MAAGVVVKFSDGISLYIWHHMPNVDGTTPGACRCYFQVEQKKCIWILVVWHACHGRHARCPLFAFPLPYAFVDTPDCYGNGQHCMGKASWCSTTDVSLVLYVHRHC